ncbi:MAG: prolipoprotein diacylglyceryl transferase [Candidatus Promineifilaceae bacterium]|jgi:phosphatidylglycerol---prolipoprotein diacylglyceryl transferase
MLNSINIDPVAFTIPIGGGFPIYWYGIIVTFGIAVGAFWAGREIQRRGYSVDELYNALIVVIVSGYFFARLTYVLLDVIGGGGDRYTSFVDVINVRQGGVNILGGFVGAAFFGWLYVRWRRLPFWDYADVAGPGLLIAQAIGRWGNFVNQELYGPPTDLPWGITIDPISRLPQYSDLTVYPPETTFHPTFLYESIWLFAGFLVLVYLNNKYRAIWRSGALFGLFLIWWGMGRTVIEFFRPDQVTIGNTPITYSMVIAFSLAVVGLYIFLLRTGRYSMGGDSRRRKRRVYKPKPRRDS